MTMQFTEHEAVTSLASFRGNKIRIGANQIRPCNVQNY